MLCINMSVSDKRTSCQVEKKNCFKGLKKFEILPLPRMQVFHPIVQNPSFEISKDWKRSLSVLRFTIRIHAIFLRILLKINPLFKQPT